MAVLYAQETKTSGAQSFLQETEVRITSTDGAPNPAIAPNLLPSLYTNKASVPENGFRRFEIIAFGSYPIMLFYTGVSFDLVNYFTNDFNIKYAPWPFRNEYSVKPDQDERILRLSVAAGAALIIAGIDAIVRLTEYRRKAQAAESLYAKDAPPPFGDNQVAPPGQAEGTPLPSVLP